MKDKLRDKEFEQLKKKAKLTIEEAKVVQQQVQFDEEMDDKVRELELSKLKCYKYAQEKDYSKLHREPYYKLQQKINSEVADQKNKDRLEKPENFLVKDVSKKKRGQ